MSAEISGRLGRARILRLGRYKASAPDSSSVAVSIGLGRPKVVELRAGAPKIVELRAAA